jgi:prophage regulatory protein
MNRTEFQPVLTTNRMVDVKTLSRAVGVSVPTLYRWMGELDFPRPIKLSARCSRWPMADVEEWIESRKASS